MKTIVRARHRLYCGEPMSSEQREWVWYMILNEAHAIRIHSQTQTRFHTHTHTHFRFVDI